MTMRTIAKIKNKITKIRGTYTLFDLKNKKKKSQKQETKKEKRNIEEYYVCPLKGKYIHLYALTFFIFRF